MDRAVATGKQNLETALQSATGLATGAVSNTVEIANKAMVTATKVTGSAVNAAGVLGEESVKAAETIGKTAIQSTTKLGTTALTTTTDVATTALTTGADVTKRALGLTKASVDIGADVAEKTLQASATITNAATQATADISKTALETTSSTVTTTTEQVGNALKAGVNLAGNATTWTLQGVDNIGKIVAGRGAITVQSTLQKQGAEVQGVTARMTKDKKDQLLKVFEQVQKQMTSTVSTLHGVQKTALAAQMNVYKRAKCGFFRRVTGFCDSKTISNDIKATELFLNDFKTTLTTAYQTAKVAIASAPEADLEAYRAIENDYLSAGADAVKTFVASYKALLDKYNKLTRQALGMTGGRRTRRVRRRPSTRRHSSRRL